MSREIYQSIGDVNLISASGTPTVSSTNASLFVDYTNPKIYQKNNLLNSYTKTNAIAYGELYLETNTTPLTAATTTTYYNTNHLAWISGETLGVSYNGGTITILPGYGGVYEVRASAGCAFSTTIKIAYIGISINAGQPSAGYFSYNILNSTLGLHSSFFSMGTFNLNSGDSVGMWGRMSNVTNGLIISDAQLTVVKIN